MLEKSIKFLIMFTFELYNSCIFGRYLFRKQDKEVLTNFQISSYLEAHEPQFHNSSSGGKDLRCFSIPQPAVALTKVLCFRKIFLIAIQLQQLYNFLIILW